MENTENEHPWEPKEDDELEVGLVARRKNINKIPLFNTINGYDLSSNNVDSVNGQDNHQQQQEEDKVKEFVKKNYIKVDEDEEEKQETQEYCVYYDTEKGVWKCRICSWDNQGRTCLTHHNQHSRWHSRTTTVYETKGIEKSQVPENTDKTINNQENGNGIQSVTIKQNGEHQKDEITFEGDINSKKEAADIEVVIDGDEEIAEYDVETVLKKQDTHDLFCPNCKSCITKRVILRKRKRRIPVPGEDAKRSKPQTAVTSELNVGLDDSSENRALNGADSSLDGVQPPTSDEYDHQREPDVFRCLSCFSIFMPTGNGFKLFRVFGNKSNEENNEQFQNEVPVKKSWFSNFLRSGYMEHTATNLNDSGAVQSSNPENNISGVSSNLNSSMQEAKSNGTTDLERNKPQLDKDIRDSNGNAILTNTNEQLLTSYYIEKDLNGKSEHPGMFVVKPPSDNNEERAESSISPLQHDGLKLLVPPNVGALIIDNSQMNQELDVTVETSNPGSDGKGKTNLSFSPPASILGQVNLGTQINSPGLAENLSIDGKEQKMDTNSVQSTDVMPEVSQHIIQNNVEIHLEEPLKVNKDVLTDKQVNLPEDVKNIERIKGKETIITIESKQLDASVSQRPPDTHGVTQAVEQGSVTTTTGRSRTLDIIKSIVYGGLIELITSLSVVASAAGADASTLNVLALGLANIFGGLFVISHDLWDLKSERVRKTEDRYQRLLGQRSDFPLHMAVSLLSYLVFGFLPPMVYGFSFRESNDKDLKLLMVAAASIACIMILAAGKAYVQSTNKSYIKTISYHVMLGIMVSGISYLFGGLIIKLLEKMEGSVGNLRILEASSSSALATF